MKIIYITQTLPYPQNTGGKIRNYSIIKILQKLGHEIVLFSFISEKEDFRYIENLKEKNVKIGKIIFNSNLSLNRNIKNIILKLIKYILNIISPIPFTVQKFRSEEMKICINHILQNNTIDCIWISYLSMTQYLPKSFNNLKILEIMDVESIIFKQMFMTDSSIKWKIYGLLEWIKSYIYEKRIFSSFDKIITISETDKNIIKNIFNKEAVTILPVIKQKKSTYLCKDVSRLLFIGNLYWYPHKDGIFWFLKKVFPLLIQRYPNITMDIIGKLPTEDIFPKYPDVSFHGYKFGKELEEFLKKPAIYVAPARYGTGLQYKILEAMKWGLPVVATIQGTKGLGRNLNDGQNILLAKDEKEFAEKIFLLFKDSRLGEKLVKNSQILLKYNYSEEKARGLLKSVLKTT